MREGIRAQAHPDIRGFRIQGHRQLGANEFLLVLSWPEYRLNFGVGLGFRV